MVLTAAQTTAFFEIPDQMGIPHATMVQMQQEGIKSVADLADFEKQSLQQLADNLSAESYPGILVGMVDGTGLAMTIEIVMHLTITF